MSRIIHRWLSGWLPHLISWARDGHWPVSGWPMKEDDTPKPRPRSKGDTP